jgi:hypothetical protein
MNFSYFIQWKNEADVKNMINYLKSNKKEIPM